MPIPDDKMNEAFSLVANGNPAAAHTLMCIARIVRLTDDIADGDCGDTQGDLAEILRLMFVELANNSFYTANASFLSGPWLNAIMGWLAGDEWRASTNRKTRMFGFVYREAIEHVAHTVAYLTGGFDHARSAMNYLHNLSHIEGSDETLEQWEDE